MSDDLILVMNLGGTSALDTVQRLRSIGVYSETVPPDASSRAILKRSPKGVVLAGGEGAREDALSLDSELFALGIPILSMGGASRVMARALGASLSGTRIDRHTALLTFDASPLFEGVQECDRYFERVDDISLPPQMKSVAFSPAGPMPAYAWEEKKLYGMQFYVERNDPDGLAILRNFACGICGCEAWWSMEAFSEQAIRRIREIAGDRRVLMSVSGGVDSSVCAALIQRAVGEKLRCLYIDTGLMRLGDVEATEALYRESLGIELICVNASERMLAALAGISDPAGKRRAVEKELSDILLEQLRALGGNDCLANGIIYPDALDSGRQDSAAVNSPATLQPIRRLFKSEVRQLGAYLDLPKELLNRQPFPGPGLAIRVVGEVTEEKLTRLRAADAIFREEIAAAGLDKRIWEYFTVLTDIDSLGIRDGKPCYETAVALRAVTAPDTISANAYRLPYDLLERAAQRITSEVKGVNRVLYDVTGKSSAMIEWE